MHSILLIVALGLPAQADAPKWKMGGWSGLDAGTPPSAQVKALSVPEESFTKQPNKFAIPAPSQEKKEAKPVPLNEDCPVPSGEVHVPPPDQPILEPISKDEPRPKASPPGDRYVRPSQPEPAKDDRYVKPAKPDQANDDQRYVKPAKPKQHEFAEGSRWYTVNGGMAFGVWDGKTVVIANEDDFVPEGEAGDKLRSWHELFNGTWAWGVLRGDSVSYRPEDVSETRPPDNSPPRRAVPVQQQVIRVPAPMRALPVQPRYGGFMPMQGGLNCAPSGG